MRTWTIHFVPGGEEAAASVRLASAEPADLARHEPVRSESVDTTFEALESQRLMRDDLGPWGRLRLLGRIVAQGDAHFDALYRRLAARFDRWAADHPAQARQSGVTAGPLPLATTTDPATTTAPSASPDQAGAGAPAAGGSPPSGIHESPQVGATGDGFAWNSLCCDTDANSASPSPDQNSEPNSDDPGEMESDSSLVSGEYFQDHQLVTYQSQGQPNDIDLQYASLQADVQPIVSGDWNLQIQPPDDVRDRTPTTRRPRSLTTSLAT